MRVTWAPTYFLQQRQDCLKHQVIILRSVSIQITKDLLVDLLILTCISFHGLSLRMRKWYVCRPDWWDVNNIVIVTIQSICAILEKIGSMQYVLLSSMSGKLHTWRAWEHVTWSLNRVHPQSSPRATAAKMEFRWMTCVETDSCPTLWKTTKLYRNIPFSLVIYWVYRSNEVNFGSEGYPLCAVFEEQQQLVCNIAVARDIQSSLGKYWGMLILERA